MSPFVRSSLAILVAATGIASSVSATAQTIKVGIVGPFSGPFAHYGTLFKNGVEAYLASQGGKLAGKDIEFIYRDTGGPNPGQTKTLVQELIVKDKVDYLGGFVFTPNAFAVAPLIQQSQTPTVIFKRRDFGDNGQVRVLHSDQLYPVAGDGATGAVGGQAEPEEDCHRRHRLRSGNRRGDGVQERVQQAGRHCGREHSHAHLDDGFLPVRAAHKSQPALRPFTHSCQAARRTWVS